MAKQKQTETSAVTPPSDLVSELVALQSQAQELHDRIAAKRAQAQDELVATILEQMAAAGFTVDEIVDKLQALNRLTGRAGGKSPKTKGAPKYRDPADPNKTWSGKGKRPKFVVDWMAAGKDLAALAV